MSVVATVAAAVGPAAAGAAAYGGPQLCGSGRARKRKDVAQDQEAADQGDDVASVARQSYGLFVLERVDEDEEEEEERSSIGAASDQEDRDEEDGDEADSGSSTAATRPRRKHVNSAGALACMDALDDALPIKRGLSNFFSGKSRSFANLQDAAAAVTSARDLAKPENPFNKRRRVLRCCSIRRVASTSLTALPPFLPPAANDENNGVDGGDSG
ncbi:hypothetical protein EJB05_41126 [Eragrostis curvula]|uniref:Uncharacterized protein n=1 Tax=Eragrostis curvula TaxID=38414 RepID=A0A5J9T931_9POAL|nr:hypothetical protein EJB05_41126 [Eragrostis curvula]